MSIRVRRFRRALLVALLGATALCAAVMPSLAQENDARNSVAFGSDDELKTDRDSFTPATSTVGAQRRVIESSYSFIDNRVAAETHSFPELLLRYGIAEWFELRLGWNYEAGGPGAATTGDEFGAQDFDFEQESRFLYGAKVQTTRQSGWLPESCTIVHANSPTSGPSPATTLVVAEVFGWTFANGWELNSAMRFGTAYEKRDYFSQWAPSTVLKIPLDPRWNAHVEYFGVVSSGAAVNFSQQLISMGGHVLLTEDFELGFRFGFGMNEQSPRYFNNVGIGWRF